MNITTDNYEAYLLDYMEGHLSPEGAKQLQAFIAAQGLDWDELTEELPYLEAPPVAYENKADLKQRSLNLRSLRPIEGSKGRSSDNRPAFIPLYVKIASAAAAAGLLLTVTLWPEKQLPKVEPIANLKSIEVSRIDTKESLALLPRRVTESIDPMPRTSLRRDDMLSKTSSKGHTISERESATLLAELPTKTVTALQTDLPMADLDEPDFEFMAWRMNANLGFAQYEANTISDEAEDEHELSFIGRGIYRLTIGRHDNFASLISSGLTTAKKEISLAVTDMALTAYYRADERFEEAKERWQEKIGE